MPLGYIQILYSGKSRFVYILSAFGSKKSSQIDMVQRVFDQFIVRIAHRLLDNGIH